MIDKAWKLSKELVWGFVLLTTLILLIGHVATKLEKDDRSETIGRTTRWEKKITEVNDVNADNHSLLLRFQRGF